MPAFLSTRRVPNASPRRCERLLPPDPERSTRARPPPRWRDYIDGLLGAFTFDPPRIWAGGPFSGRHGGAAGLRALLPLDSARGARLAHADRRIAAAIPSASSTARSSACRSNTAHGLAALGADFATLDRRGPGHVGSTQVAEFRALLYSHACEGMYGDPVYGGNHDVVGLDAHRLRRRRPTARLHRRRGRARSSTGDDRRDAVIVGLGSRRFNGRRRASRPPAGTASCSRRVATTSSSSSRRTAAHGDYSNDELKFIDRHFLGPDPFLEPRTFRRDDGATASASSHRRRQQPARPSVGAAASTPTASSPASARIDFHLRSGRADRRRGRSTTGRSSTTSSSRTTPRRSGSIGVAGDDGGNPFAAVALGAVPDAAGPDMFGATLSTAAAETTRTASVPRANWCQQRGLRRPTRVQQLRVLRHSTAVPSTPRAIRSRRCSAHFAVGGASCGPRAT